MEQATTTSSSSSSATATTNHHTKRRPVLVLVNPHSGRGKSVAIYRKRLLPFFNSHGIEHHVFITEKQTRVYDYIRNKSLLELNNLKSIVIVSGDGLFHETINGLMARKDWQQAITVPLGVVPTGSGNGLAYTLLRQLHLGDLSKGEAVRLCCEQAVQEGTSQADLVQLTFGRGTNVWSFLSTGWGLLADIDIDSEWLRFVGETRFTIYGLLRSLTSTSYRGRLSYRVAPEFAKAQANEKFMLTESNSTNKMYSSSSHTTTTNGKTSMLSETDTLHTEEQDVNKSDDWIHIEDKFVCVYAVYQTHVSSVTKFSPKSTLTDQLIYLTYIRGKLSACKKIEFLLAIEDGSHANLPYVTVVPVTSFKLQPLESSKIVVDGEVIPWNLSDGPIEAKILPKVMKLAWAETK